MVKRSTQQWHALFKQHDDSGMTAAQFCRDNDLCPKYFAKRKRDLGWGSQASTTVKLVKLNKPKRLTSPPVVLRYGDCQLSLCVDTSPDWVAQLMKALA